MPKGASPEMQGARRSRAAVDSAGPTARTASSTHREHPSVNGTLGCHGCRRLAFLVNLPIGALAWLAGGRVLAASTHRRPDSSPDYLGALLVATALGLLSLASRGDRLVTAPNVPVG